jgi:hypothetical protein
MVRAMNRKAIIKSDKDFRARKKQIEREAREADKERRAKEKQARREVKQWERECGLRW